MIKKTMALLLLVLIQFAACACSDNSNTVDNTDNNVEISEQPNFTGELDWDTHELMLTYANGHTVHFSLDDKLMLEGRNEGEFSHVAWGCSWAGYENISAVFIPPSPYLYYYNPDSVLEISRDNGETWQEMTVPADEYDITKSAIGFTSQDNIWLLLEGGLGLGHAHLRFYKSEDGGGTWAYEVIGAPVADAPVEDRRLDYINFLSADEGYLSVGAGFYGAAPMLYKTVDGGETWIECTVKTKIKSGDYFSVDDIRYNGDVLIMYGHLVHGSEVILTSKDGLSWTQR